LLVPDIAFERGDLALEYSGFPLQVVGPEFPLGVFSQPLAQIIPPDDDGAQLVLQGL